MSLSPDLRERLIQAAVAARKRAYAPYSGYQVGAALLTIGNTIISGCNVENGVYPATICAERTAVVKAVSDGSQKFTAIAVATDDGAYPCGMCRQTLYEFAPDLVVLIADSSGRLIAETPLVELLPHGFRLNASNTNRFHVTP